METTKFSVSDKITFEVTKYPSVSHITLLRIGSLFHNYEITIHGSQFPTDVLVACVFNDTAIKRKGTPTENKVVCDVPPMSQEGLWQVYLRWEYDEVKHTNADMTFRFENAPTTFRLSKFWQQKGN